MNANSSLNHLVAASLVMQVVAVARDAAGVRGFDDSAEAPIYERFDGKRGTMAIDDQALVEILDQLAAGDVGEALAAFAAESGSPSSEAAVPDDSLPPSSPNSSGPSSQSSGDRGSRDTPFDM